MKGIFIFGVVIRIWVKTLVFFFYSETDIPLKRQFYDFAFKSYNRALAILETRKQNPVLWDLVVWELSTGTFALAQHMIDNIPKADMVSTKRL